MEIIMKEIDVLSTFYENADLDDIAQANIYLEAGGNGKISEAINKIGEKIKDIIRQIHEFYHEMRLKLEEQCINKRLSRLVDNTTYQIGVETNNGVLAYNAKKLMMIHDAGVKKINHVRVQFSSGRLSANDAAAQMRTISDKAVTDIKSTSEEILEKSSDSVKNKKGKTKVAYKKDIERILSGYQDEYNKITTKLEDSCAKNIEHLWMTSKKKKNPTQQELALDQLLASLFSLMNKAVGSEISRIFTALSKGVIVAAPSDTFELNLKKDRDMATMYGTAIGVKMSMRDNVRMNVHVKS